jgi:soluble lytic murein transglycosylase-like protein
MMSRALVFRPALHIVAADALVTTVSAANASYAWAQAPSDKYDDTFRKYTKRSFGPGFDWRIFKAQGMAESNLDSDARSKVGARGIMQLMPSTYKEVRSRNPELGKIDDPAWNIAAGIAYNRQLWKQWQPDSDAGHLLEFMFGSYNAGRGTLLRAQRVARDRALDQRVWPSIQSVAASVPRWRSTETLTYVDHIKANLQRMDDKGRVILKR